MQPRAKKSTTTGAHIKQVLLAIRNVNQLILHEEDPIRLIEQACTNLTEALGYSNAWIALLDDSHHVIADAAAGFDATFERLSERMRRGAFPECMQRTLQSKATIVTENPLLTCPDCPLSPEYAGRIGLSRCLYNDGRCYGILVVSAPGEFATSQEAQDLFAELADDLAFGLNKIEARARQRKTEEELRASEEKFSKAFLSSPDAFMFTSVPDGRIIDVNAGFTRISEYRAEEAVGRTTTELNLWVDQAARDAYVAQVGRDGWVSNFETTFRTRSGKIITGLISGTTIHTRDGLLFLSIIRDISLRKQMEETLRFTQDVVEHLNDAVYWANAGGDLVYVNTAACRKLGYSRPELLALNVVDLDLQITRPKWTAHWESLKQQGALNFESLHRTKDGHLIPVEIHTNYIRFREEELACGIATDISARKQAEEQLREREHFLHMILETTLDGFWIVDSRGQILEVNDAYCAMSGYPRNELIGKVIVELDAAESPEETALRIQQLMQSETGRFETWHRRKDGSVFPVEISTRFLAEKGGRFVSFCRDITERHKAEAALQRSATEFKTIANFTVDWESWFAPDGSYRWVNSASELISGYTVAEIMALPDFGSSVIAEEDRARFIRLIQENHSRNKAENLEFRYIRKDGEKRWLGASWQSIFDEEKNYLGVRASYRDITLRKIAEEAAREASLRLQESVQASNIGLWDWDLTSNKVYYSREWKQQIGYAEAEIGNDFTEWENRVHPDDLAVTKTIVRQAITNRLPRYFTEFRFRHKDGSFRWILAQCSIHLNESGQPIRILGSHVDMTEQKQREAQIALLGRMLDDAPAAITIHDTSGRFFFANQAAVILHGYENKEEFLAVNLHDLDMPESEARLDDRFRLIGAAGEARFEVAHFRKDHSTFPLEVVAKVIDWDGQPAILSIATDISERHQAEETLHRIRFALDQTQGIVLWTDADAKIVDVNHGACHALGYSRQELLAFDISAITDFSKRQHAELWVDCKQRQMINFESVYRRKDGTTYPVEVFSHYFQFAGQEYLFSLAFDITERKRTQAEQEKLREQLNQAQKMESIGRLAGGVAHDFNNMLGVILGNAELAFEHIEPRHPLYTVLAEIRNAADRSAGLTRQLLAYARKQTITPKVLDLNVTVAGMLKMVERLIGENIDLVWLPGKKLWPVKMDPSQIDQILANLCVNARDAIAEVGTTTIKTANATFDPVFCAKHPGFSPGDFVLLSVSDTGCGMDKETLAHLFEPFFTTKEVGKGTGLGLATVYGIVSQNNGFIITDSQPGQGTTVAIYLPRHGKASGPLHETDLVPVIAGGDETILVVEDEPAILKMTQKMLEQLGYRVLTADSPDAAMQLALDYTDPVHLLITDVVMPWMNGRDLARQMTAFYPNLKSLFMSGYTADVIAPRGVLEAGVHFVQKPFTKKELADAIREVLEERTPPARD